MPPLCVSRWGAALQLSAQAHDTLRCKAAVTVPDEAVQAAVEKVQPEMPPLAKKSHIQGIAKIRCSLSASLRAYVTKHKTFFDVLLARLLVYYV